MTDEMKKNELNEQQLESVAGGECGSGSTPEFQMCQCVIYHNGEAFNSLGYVKEISTGKNGAGCSEFTYTIEVFAEVGLGAWRKIQGGPTLYDIPERKLTLVENAAEFLRKMHRIP